MEFKHSTTWNSSIPLHGIQIFHYMEFKLAEWIRKFHHMKFIVPFTTDLKLTMDLTDFQYQVLDFYLFFIHTVGSTSKYEIEIIVLYSITHMPFLCSIQILFVSLMHHLQINLKSQGKNEQRNREENQQSLQKPSRILLANKPFAGNASISLTGYHPP